MNPKKKHSIWHGDCLEIMRAMPENSVESIVTDPPYFLTNATGSGFMGKSWDSLSVARAVVESFLRSMTLVENQNETYQADKALTKDEATVLCSVMLPNYANAVIDMPINIHFVINPLMLNRSAATVLREVATILLDDPAWTSGEQKIGIKPKSPDSAEFQKTIGRVAKLSCVADAIKICSSAANAVSVLSEVFHAKWAKEAFKVLKPGGYLLAFGGTRTFHRLISALEDVGFENRDCIMWIHGSGFPKSVNVGKNIDKHLGKKPIDLGIPKIHGDGKPTHYVAAKAMLKSAGASQSGRTTHSNATKPSTPAGKRYEGFGTAIKPAWEPICMCRKPLSEKTVAANVLKHGTGALNIDACRVGENPRYRYNANKNGTTFHGQQGKRIKQSAEKKGSETIESTKGRFPANLVHDGSDEVLALFSTTKSGTLTPYHKKNVPKMGYGGVYGDMLPTTANRTWKGDSGSAARFFYQAKPSRRERDAGTSNGNKHPTVKSIKLMQWLIKLVTRPGGLVLDPFCGSGSTGCAAVQSGFSFIGIEQDASSVETARERMAHWAKECE